MAMTREDCLVKLLALEAEPLPRITAITGWPKDEVAALLTQLVAQRRIHATGVQGQRQYFVPNTASATPRIVRLARQAETNRRLMRAKRAHAGRLTTTQENPWPSNCPT